MQNLSLSVLKKAYSDGELSPKKLSLELRDQALAQADFNAWIYVLSEAELERYCDALSTKSPETHPLYGVPFAIKDNIDLAGVPTTAACPDFKYTPEKSAFVVQQLIDAGAIPLGKTNLDQFATGLVGVRSPYGEGKNVFNTDYISGGSSAGSAIATALGQVSFALGTDTAGSGRVPAAFNNLIGLKPSKGLLSNTGVVPACKSLDCVSVFALNCQDAATVFDVAAVYDAEDCFSNKKTWNNQANYLKAEVGPFKFAVPSELTFDSDTDSEALFLSAVKQLESLGGEKIEIDFSAFIDAAKLLYEGPWVAERQWATQDVKTESMVPVLQTILDKSKVATAIDCFDAQYKLQTLKKQCDALMAGFDFILTPTTPTAYSRAQLSEEPIALNSKLGTYTNFMNLLDYAAVAVPTGALPSGVHWGVTLFAQRDSDINLLSFADALHRASLSTVGATEFAIEPVNAPVRPDLLETIDVVVCGAHLSGMPLNWQLTERGATLISQTQSAEHYRLYALPGGRRPALVHDADGGRSIAVEVWRLPAETFGSFVAGIPAPLGIGKTELIDGTVLPGFICEEKGIVGATEVTEYGGWKAWLQQG